MAGSSLIERFYLQLVGDLLWRTMMRVPAVNDDGTPMTDEEKGRILGEVIDRLRVDD